MASSSRASKRPLNQKEIDELLLNYSSDASENSSDSEDSDEYLPSDEENETTSNHESNDSAEMIIENDEPQEQIIENENDEPVEIWSENIGLPIPFEFTGNPGMKYNILENTVLEFVRIFISEAFVSMIKEETNNYARQLYDTLLENNLIKQYSLMATWKDTSVDELYIYFALSFLMGVVHKPQLQLYWSENHFICTPIFSTIMPRRRFLQLRKCLHFSNNLLPLPNDKLSKIRPVLDHFLNMFQEVYIPDSQIVIDEILQKWKGRLSFRQYIPSKRARFGIKLFLLCEVKTNYTWNIIIYTGQGTNLILNAPIPEIDQTKLGQPTNIILSLTEKLFNKGYVITCDNWYGSPELCNVLMKVGTDCYGTARANRKDLPPNFKKMEPKIHDPIVFQKGKVVVIRWRDPYKKKKKKIVTLISTIHDGTEIPTGTRTKEGEEKIKPIVILDYNKTMGGVDAVSQLTDPYKCARKGKKWYRKLFEYLMDIALLNSYILYKMNNPTTKMTHLDFILKTVEGLVEKHCYGLRPIINRPPTDSPTRLTGRHFPNHIPPNPPKKAPTRKCKVCAKQGRRKETRFMCKKCNFTPLCTIPCFEKYHTLQDYGVNNSDSSD